MTTFERNCDTLYGTNAGLNTQLAKSQADNYLRQYTEEVGNIDMLFYFFENSGSKYVKFLAAAAIKELLTKNLNKIPPRIPPEKLITFKEYLMAFIRDRATQTDEAVVKMVITLLSKLVKLSWFDQPALKCVVSELLQL